MKILIRINTECEGDAFPVSQNFASSSGSSNIITGTTSGIGTLSDREALSPLDLLSTLAWDEHQSTKTFDV